MPTPKQEEPGRPAVGPPPDGYRSIDQSFPATPVKCPDCSASGSGVKDDPPGVGKIELASAGANRVSHSLTPIERHRPAGHRHWRGLDDGIGLGDALVRTVDLKVTVCLESLPVQQLGPIFCDQGWG